MSVQLLDLVAVKLSNLFGLIKSPKVKIATIGQINVNFIYNDFI